MVYAIASLNGATTTDTQRSRTSVVGDSVKALDYDRCSSKTDKGTGHEGTDHECPLHSEF